MRKVVIGSSYCESVPPAIEGYELLRQIGRGHYSTIFLATKGGTDEKYAVKIVSRKFLVECGAVTNFEREVTVFSKLDHPNIVKFYEMLSDDALIYIIMEYCPKGTLQDIVNQMNGLGEKDSKQVVRQICLAVSHIHSLGIAHRDLKLENILIGDGGVVKLGDFGFSRELANRELMQTQCGSPIYAPPEIVEHKEYDGRKADMWSLGVCIFAIVSGTAPWRDTQNLTNLFYDIQTARYHVPNNFSALFKNLIHSLMHPLPEMRLTAQQVLDHPWLTIGAGSANTLRFFVGGGPVTDSDRAHSMVQKLTAPLAMRFKQMQPLKPRRRESAENDADDAKKADPDQKPDA